MITKQIKALLLFLMYLTLVSVGLPRHEELLTYLENAVLVAVNTYMFPAGKFFLKVKLSNSKTLSQKQPLKLSYLFLSLVKLGTAARIT